MPRTISIGNQTFSSLIENNNFYVDKTSFIKEWWEGASTVTLITRPRRFGKTLNMNMLECFFSNHYQNRSDLFEGLSIWNEEKFRNLQGTYPVIFLSFAEIKSQTFESMKKDMLDVINDVYKKYRNLLDSDILTESEKNFFSELDKLSNTTEKIEIQKETLTRSIKNLSMYLERYYKKKAIILLDEYDTPMQEAYVNGFWNETVEFMRSFFNSTFKTNPYMERAVLTGIYKFCYEPDNQHYLSTLDERYSEYFSENKIANRELENDSLISKVLRLSPPSVKKDLEDLIEGKAIVKRIDEQIVFNYLDKDEEAIWSFLLASGYLKSESVDYRGETREPYHTLRITNIETKATIENLMKGWFASTVSNYNSFVKYLLEGDIEAMNHYMNNIALETFSLFDVAGKPSEYLEPERFYHGFVLGLMVDRREDYAIKSNRESGFGRYDIVMIPKNKSNPKTPAIVIEFKVQNKNKEPKLQDSVNSALQQIQNKNSDADLIQDGVNPAWIRHYGFAFCGKTVLIG